ncbi:hypothetical protein TRFO_19796 [Tritrichomonas foetus]|uniref:Uncharacterized protein n=1 Tax=Tritrichomonas foetus TaxID=1144522 RepID=A0A1J4KHG9_9EUKA|nr:hypothetical protein TRFO_19796 [Tritrichomonas foetus]|eukprot:OHT10817.1 hypothetical protein TRFO_19796 [Tritrichomonas foetus]
MFQESISSSSGYCCFNHIEQESMITISDFQMTDDSATFSNQNNCGYSIANKDHKFVNENVKSDVNLMSNNGDDNFSCIIGNMNSIGEKCSNDTWHNNGDLCFIIGNLSNFYNYSYSENCSGEVFNPDFEIPEITYHDSCETLSKLSAVKIDEYNPPCYSPIEPSFPSVNHSNNFSLSINNNIMMKNKITTMNNEINYKNINNNLINNHIVNNICSNHNSFSQNLPIRNIDNYERQCLESNWINYTEEDYNLNFLNNDDDNDSDNTNMGHSNFQCSENDLGLLTQKLEENY